MEKHLYGQLFPEEPYQPFNKLILGSVDVLKPGCTDKPKAVTYNQLDFR